MNPRINYEVHGQGEPLVLLHGNGEKIATLQRQIDEFSQNFKVIAIDSRAHGKSEMGNTPLSYNLMMEDIVRVMDELNISQFSLFGFSDGGIIGLLIAIHHPERLKRLVIVGANSKPSGFKFTARLSVWWLRSKAQWRMFRHKGGKRSYWLMDMMLREPNISNKELSQIQAPTLILAGENDMIKDRHTKNLHRMIAPSKLAIIAGGDHFLPQKKAEEVNRLVVDFLSVAHK